ncbi:hypothetical protein NKI51_30420 [Mesorhizobium australicum]|uniref:hypothetical protein n=1 Tax=Mesorhizobium australicum TaxID=536018 RepID=UPI003337FF0E
MNDVVSEIKLVQDVAAKRFDIQSLSDQAQKGYFFSYNAPGVQEIITGNLKEVCPTGSVINNYGRQYQFRTNYERGSLDWLVTTPSDLGSKIEDIVFFVMPDPAKVKAGGVPTVLPILPEGAQILPPGNLCLSPEEIKLLEDQDAKACADYPGLCDK